jgi:16S rRNA processing protein RimM
VEPASAGRERVSVVVGRIGRPHGVRGDATVEVRTDEPERRFAPGCSLATDRPDQPVLVVEGRRWHSGRLLLHFAGVDDRDAIESLRGAVLSVEVDPAEQPSDPDEYYDHQLVGLCVVDRGGQVLGVVSGVLHGAQDLLVVTAPGQTGPGQTGPGQQGEALVPFVKQLVPEVDLSAGEVVVDLPDGLLDLPPGTAS